MTNRNLLSWIELSKKALSHNIKSLEKLSGKSKLAVSVKANAYGHGLLEISGLLSHHNEVEYLTVHSFDEALTARLGGWQRKIMILGPVQANMLEALFEYGLEPVIFEKSTLRNLG
ncbi:MAG: alanine racemase, partial [candidate division Zixibacteria bacterium]|nr:alanine racemase [candidate division Zixibacteria bacterium]